MLIRTRTVVLLIILLGLLLYMNSLSNSFLGDDIHQIIENPAVHNLKNIPSLFFGGTYYSGEVGKSVSLYYRPMMQTVYALIYSVAKDRSAYFHFVQLIFHIANTLLLFFFLKKLMKLPYAFAVSLLFMIHPINNEAVVYIANMQDTLFVFFGLLALLILSEKTKNIMLSGVFLLLSLFAKETAVLFIVLAIAYYLIRFKKNWQIMIAVTLGSGLIYGLFRFPIAHVFTSQRLIAPIAKATLAERILSMPKIFYYYLSTFFFPYHLSVGQFWIVKHITFKDFIMPLLVDLLFFALLIIGAVFVYKKNKKRFMYFSFFVLWFLVGIGLHMQLLPLDSTVADRWFYAASIGLLGTFAIIFEQIKIQKQYAAIVPLVIIIISLILAARTFVRNFDWKDELTLYKHDLPYNEEKFFLANSIGSDLIEEGKFAEAKPYIQMSIRSFPYYGNLNNMAVIALSEHNTPLARKYLEEALRQPNNYIIVQNYSNFLLKYGSAKEAMNFAKKAIRTYPGNPKLWQNLAVAEEKLEKTNEAKEAREKAEALQRNQ